MTLPALSFCWNGLISTDIPATLAFFPAVLGWTVEHVQMGPDTVPTLKREGVPMAHVRGPAMDGEPSWWNTYISVEDVDTAAAAFAKTGGAIVVPATDIPPGRFATVSLPSGAMFTLFTHAEGYERAEGQGTPYWVDLHSSDIEGDLMCLNDAIGLTTDTMPMPTGPYYLLNPGGSTKGGAMQAMHQGPSMWCAWDQVADVDATLAAVKAHGGAVLSEPWDAPGVGRMAIVADPAGIVFGVITPPAA